MTWPPRNRPIPKADFDRMVEACRNPPPPSEGLKALISKVRAQADNRAQMSDAMQALVDETRKGIL